MGNRFLREGQTQAQANQGKLPELTPQQHSDPDFLGIPRYWVPGKEVESRLRERWECGWLLGWRDICRSTDERTVIAGVIPRVGAGDTFLLMLPASGPTRQLIAGNLSSYVLDFVARQKVGGTHLKYHTFKQLPLLGPETFERDDVDYILETFPIVKGKDVKEHGDYRTKLVILDIYDRLQEAIDTGEPYPTRLDPPPADAAVAHAARPDDER